jgi:hypothetical protein
MPRQTTKMQQREVASTVYANAGIVRQKPALQEGAQSTTKPEARSPEDIRSKTKLL